MSNPTEMWRMLKTDCKGAEPKAMSPEGYCHNPTEVAVVRSCRAGKMCSDSEDILKVELTVFADGENKGHERKQGGRGDAKVSDLSNWKNGISNRGKKDCGWPFSPGIWMKD